MRSEIQLCSVSIPHLSLSSNRKTREKQRGPAEPQLPATSSLLARVARLRLLGPGSQAQCTAEARVEWLIGGTR